MSKVLFLVLCLTVSSVTSLGGVMIGPGRWLVLNIGECEEPDQYELIFKLNRRKLNRTHDCFYGDVDFDRDINTAIGLQIDIYQEMDGGFKFHQTRNDSSFCNFIKYYAEENMRKLLVLAKVDPPDCPIKSGAHEFKDFVMDYRELPLLGVYGTFLANTFLMYEGKKIGCIKLLLNYDKRNDEDHNDDEYGLI